MIESKNKIISALTLLLILIISVSAQAQTWVESSIAAATATNVTMPKTAKVLLANAGTAIHPIVHAAGASADTIAAANELAEYLFKITGATFAVQSGDGRNGIVLGKNSDFSGVIPPYPKDAGDPENQDDFVIRSHVNGLYLIGAGESGVRNAVWYFLAKLGYAQFLPTQNWEYVPSIPKLQVKLNVKLSPTYKIRNLNAVDLSSFKEMNEKWEEKNLMKPALIIQNFAMYGSILADKEYDAEMDLHPEYVSSGDKLCVFETGLQDIVWDWTQDQFATYPEYKGSSTTPNDGMGEWDCPSSPEGMSTSDQALYLANSMAEKLAATSGTANDLSDKEIGMLAYGDTSFDPTVYTVHEKVNIFAATAYMQDGRTFEEVVKGWHDSGAQQMGFYDYPSVILWQYDAKPAKINRVDEWLNDLVYYHQNYGFKYYHAEFSRAYGPYGLGYWLLARALWNPKQALEKHLIEKWKQEFFNKMFGTAATIMQEFYHLLENDVPPEDQVLISTHLIGKMYLTLSDALNATADASVQTRIRELIQYVRYLELYLRLKQAQNPCLDGGSAALPLYIDLLRHSRRMENTHMIYNYGLFNYWEQWDGTGECKEKDNVLASLGVTDISQWNMATVFPEGPYSEAEIDTILAAGVAANPLREWETITFTDDLIVPGVALNAVPKGDGIFSMSADVEFYVFADGDLNFSLEITPGDVDTTKGNPIVELKEIATDQIVFSEEYVADNIKRAINIPAMNEGLHILAIKNNHGTTTIEWDLGTRIVKAMKYDDPDLGISPAAMYFFVPEGTTVVGGYNKWGSANAKLVDPDGVTFTMKYMDYFSIPITDPAKTGKLWKFVQCYDCLVNTVPPYIGMDDSEMLVPRESVPE